MRWTGRAWLLAGRARTSFGLRLGIGMTLTLLVLGAIEYARVSDNLEDRLLERALVEAQADAHQIAFAYTSTLYGDQEQSLVTAVKGLGVRPHLTRVALVDERGRVVLAQNGALIGSRVAEPEIREAIEHGRSSSARRKRDGEDVFAYVVPVYLPERVYALQIEEDDSVLGPQLADLRQHTLRFLLIGVPLGVVLMYLLAGRALSRRHRRVIETSMRDGLTGLGNHRAFQEELRRATATALRHDEPLALAMIDLDDFKLANDRNGHGYGDQLLSEFARLIETSRREDRAFRVGGDEFAIVLARTDLMGARRALERIRARAADRLSGVTISGGVAELDRNSPNVDGLVQAADAALYEAKRRGRNSVATFHEVEAGSSLVTVGKVAALRSLLDEGEIAAAFQPIWHLPGGGLLGYEALARPADSYGFSGPAEAFQIAEAIGRAHQLDHLCVRAIMEQAGSLPASSLLFVNLSPQTLENDLLSTDELVSLVTRAGLTPERVVIEITERANARRSHVVEKARELRQLGFLLALDDAGAGNAGLEMLGSVQVDYVKVDNDVVRAAVEDRSARAVLAALLAFASQTGAYVIAEGIETEAMLALVTDPELPRDIANARVHGAQGFLLGEPAAGLEDRLPVAPELLAYERM